MLPHDETRHARLPLSLSPSLPLSISPPAGESGKASLRELHVNKSCATLRFDANNLYTAMTVWLQHEPRL